MAVCLSFGGVENYASSSPSDEVLAGTADGVLSLRRGDTREWYVARKSLEGCYISSLMIEPSSGFIFAGVDKGSLYVSGDSGLTWEPRDKGLTQKDVYSLGFRNDGGETTLYVGTEPAHLFESHDLGESWHELPALRSVPSVPRWTFPGGSRIAHVKYIAPDPSHSKTIYICIEVGGLLKSEDGGLSWEQLGAFDDVHRLLVLPSDSNCLYLAHGGGHPGIYRSRDGGKSWDQLTKPSMRIGYPDSLLIHPHREGLMFMAGAISGPGTWRATRTADSRIARSRDGGETWDMLHQGLPEHIRHNIEAVTMEVWNGSFALFAGTTDGDVFYSDDEGERWRKIVDGIPPISKRGHYQTLRRA